ncbi:hypothetical protein J2741_001047 [Methanolinea mesophila]|nr:hypothetical protein [Methanolinea mesophila]
MRAVRRNVGTPSGLLLAVATPRRNIPYRLMPKDRFLRIIFEQYETGLTFYPDIAAAAKTPGTSRGKMLKDLK